MWLLIIPPHIERVATLPCNLLLIACLLRLMFYKLVWQRNICARCDGILNNHFTENLLQNPPVKEL